MATKLIYPKLPYVRLGLWTFKIKIGYYTGIDYTDILLWQNSTSLHLEFKVDLNQTQIDWITALTQREDVQGPDTDLILVNNTYVITTSGSEGT